MSVVYTVGALADLEGILSYIARHDRNAAADVAARIEKAIADIAQFPHASRLDPGTGVREHVISGLPFLIIYTASDRAIEIIAIFHTARNPAIKAHK